MSELIINGRVYPSIWKKENTTTETINTNHARHRQAYRDPTASAAIDNVLREERNKNRKKRPNIKQTKRR
jgi:hypothetical protein